MSDLQSMSEHQQRMQPWQVFHAARKALGANIVARIFNREIRSAHNWAQDPTYTQARCKSPLELMHSLFEKLDEVGRGYVAQTGIDYCGLILRGFDPARGGNAVRKEKVYRKRTR